MSALVRRIPREQRLRVTAKYEHQTLKFEGNIFEFVQHLMDQKLTGKGTFTVNQGGFCGLQFDIRALVPQEAELTIVQNRVDSDSG